MLNVDSVVAEARVLGAEHGRGAGSWVEFRSEDEARAWLMAYEDGDPEAYDSVPSAPLSGEWADGMTPARLLEELGVKDCDDRAPLVDEVCAAYEEAYEQAATDEVVRIARAMAERTILVHLNVRVWDSRTADAVAELVAMGLGVAASGGDMDGLEMDVVAAEEV